MEEAAARKAKLKALREKAEAAQGETPVIKFRNYNPRDQKINHEKIEPAKVPEAPADEKPTLTTDVEPLGAADASVSVAPKKANWDLRRDVEDKLAKLERRTQRAMVELMQEEQERLEGALEADG
mmetsp:Transcript_23501/g.65160  ORF Transcript_23501/g.65160 Transcript_23501/m.65160 type:complete len:125 (-) Transcript_23501:147-521(-)|eukprot:CAMPEP_0117675524 /NCGR_PEP_ID=MMETSP0804-20121206/15655_1 /TAXON_ID=1074897 /ORGANISM="Tetraselmis astigmatica, Strain CCMP880" /LENGTH=124 /DNA_ID=CAMNT_0005484541 /DNA_START=178 /DNA_END=552 /DNA_ORIENTATION=+